VHPSAGLGVVSLRRHGHPGCARRSVPARAQLGAEARAFDSPRLRLYSARMRRLTATAARTLVAAQGLDRRPRARATKAAVLAARFTLRACPLRGKA
jgi:hypothetical protein